MLVQFLVENFRSFKDETVFSMRAPPGETAAVTSIPGFEGLRLMRAAAFYGANASGKSNLVQALRVASHLIMRGSPAGEPLPVSPFRLALDSLSKPSRFQFDFLSEGVLYSYVLIIASTTVKGESLYRKLPGMPDDELIFEREAPDAGSEHRVEFGPMVLSGDAEQQQFARFIAKGTPASQPMLTEFATRNVPGFATIHAWFGNGLAVIRPTDPYLNLVKELFESQPLRDFYGEMLYAMGTGVQRVEVIKEQSSEELSRLFRDIDEVTSMPKAKEVINTLLAGSLRPDSGVDIEKSGAATSILTLILEHSTRSGPPVAFSLTEESDGTRRLLHLLPVLFHGTKGPCMVIDELDRSLHTALTRRFVEEFMAMSSGAQSQLIFTTHDTNLLNGRLLPPGSIWFVEKDDDGASHLHSLAEYRAEQLEHLLEHLEDGYLQGRFGAIPFLARRDKLDWQAEEHTG